MSSSGSSKPQFYTFDGSVWSSAPRLAIAELGYDLDNDFDVKTLVLLEGQNFDPVYLKIQPSGTIPVLADLQGDVLDSTVKVVKYLVANAPVKPADWEPAQPELIDAFHAADIDPNDSLLGYSLNDEQRKAKAADVPGKYWNGRKAALEKYQATAPEELKKFYQDKIQYNSYFVDIYTGKASPEKLNDYYAKAAKLWKAIGAFINGTFTKALAEKSSAGPFFGGEKPGEVDFHAIAWLARTVTAAGGVDQLSKLANGLPDNVKQYYETWAARDSFRKLQIQ